MNVPRKVAKIEPLTENWFELEGHRLEVIPEVMGDMKYNSVVWIPSIRTLFGSDVLFNQAHPFTCELTGEERRQGIPDIEGWEECLQRRLELKLVGILNCSVVAASQAG